MSIDTITSSMLPPKLLAMVATLNESKTRFQCFHVNDSDVLWVPSAQMAYFGFAAIPYPGPTLDVALKSKGIFY